MLKFVMIVLFLSVTLFYPNQTYAGSFWGWETTWQGSYLTNDGCLYLIESQVYNVFGINAGLRTTYTLVGCSQ